MMTEMTKYKQQTDIDDDECSVGSTRPVDLTPGITTIRYHMGRNWWRSRTNLEKSLLVGWAVLIFTVTILLAILHFRTDHTHHSNSSQANASRRGGECMTPECVMIAGSILRNMNMSADPCGDFYNFACGGWVKENPIPSGKAMWGTLTKLAADNQIIMRHALESDFEHSSQANLKTRMFYQSCLDANKTIEKLGATPLKKLIKKLGWSIKTRGWSSGNSSLLETLVATKVTLGSSAFFSWGVSEDDKNSSQHILQVDQGGLTLPTREDYLNQSEKAVVDAYMQYITKVEELLGVSKEAAEKSAQNILDVETSLANITTPDDQRRDEAKIYHRFTLTKMQNSAPFISWLSFFNAAFKMINKSLSPSTPLVVFAPEYIGNLSLIVHQLNSTSEGRRKLMDYMIWHGIKSYVGYLSQDFRDAAKVLEKAQLGVVGTEETWHSCVDATDAALGLSLGAMYVRTSFNADSKTKAEDMISNIRDRFRERLLSVQWMDDETRSRAVEKADAISEMIGYPDYIMDDNELDKKFVDLNISDDEFFDNNFRVMQHVVKENLKRLFEPVNKTKWDMTPPSVNAYYSPTKNEIVFPAGILQPPLFRKTGPVALSYGAVGVVVGHELAHAFDDQGRQYNKDGNLRNWWANSTVEKFEIQTRCFEHQYSSYELNNEYVNGKLTLGENIADNGGLRASYSAYLGWLEKNGPEPSLPAIDLTSQQLFFLGFAQVWCSSMSKEATHLELQKDSHSPAQFRVRGTLANSKQFAEHYGCPVGTNMNPRNKCEIW